jgi:N-acetylgalactosamine-6-sulfatase
MYGIDTVEVIGKSKGESAGRDDDLTRAAIQFMKQNADQPFYVNIWGHSTHFPVNPPPKLAGAFNEIEVNRRDFSETMQHKFDESVRLDQDLDESMRQYLGDVYSIDLNVGRVLEAIDELGIRDNTIVVFSSDHGPAPVIVASKGPREFSKNMLGYAGEFRGGKHTQFEGGTRVPLIIRWPGHVKAGRVDTQCVTSFIDWMPTLCAIVGIKQLPEQLDGEDISDIWLGAERERSKPLYWRVSSSRAAPAMRDAQWKLHLGSRRDAEVELYNLSDDPAESRNVAEQHPDVVARMTAKLEAWVAELPEEYEKKKGRKK